MKKILIVVIVMAGIVLGVCGFFFFQIWACAQSDSNEKVDAIVVLGAAEYDGRPSPVFAARLDHALGLFKQNIAPVVITTGGKFPGETQSEGAVGKGYLARKGIPLQKIFAEENSLTTKQNLARVAEIMEEKKLTSVVLVSDPFHMYRAKLIAKDLGLTVSTSPTQTSPISKNIILEIKYMLRETFLSMAHILFDI